MRQVEGKDALRLLRIKIATSGPQVLWAGSLASAGDPLFYVDANGHYTYKCHFKFC